MRPPHPDSADRSINCYKSMNANHAMPLIFVELRFTVEKSPRPCHCPYNDGTTLRRRSSWPSDATSTRKAGFILQARGECPQPIQPPHGSLTRNVPSLVNPWPLANGVAPGVPRKKQSGTERRLRSQVADLGNSQRGTLDWLGIASLLRVSSTFR